MPTLQAGIALAPDAANLFIWERQARPVMNDIVAIGTGPARAVVMGNAGSGKSTMLRELRRLLGDRSPRASMLGDTTDIERIPRDHVLLVDDLHLLAGDQIDHLRQRSEDPEASLVVTSRPWPRVDSLARITRSLERSRPAIVLGHVSRSDIEAYVGTQDAAVPASCVDHVLGFTGGVSWLVSEALALHDVRDCRDDSEHRALRHAIEDRIAHRLDSIPSDLRQEIEALCVAPGSRKRALGDYDDVVAQGYAEGLLSRNGTPVPLVRSAVRASIPVRRLIDLSSGMADEIARAAQEGDQEYRGWLGDVRDPDLGRALVDHADRMLEQNPRRALDLYDSAVECGVAPASIGGLRAHAAWAAGEIDRAGSIIDELPTGSPLADVDQISDTSAAIWSVRGMLRTSDAVYRSLPPHGAESRARASIAATGVGRAIESGPEATAPDDDTKVPSTLGVALELLERGLHATLSPDASESAVADLVRASELYTSASTSAPIPELPAVIAAIVAMNIGDLDIAHTVIEDAIAGEQGGEWARTRLLLWRSWLALQRSRPLAAREALARALDSSPSRSARDEILTQAIRVAIARRYEDTAALSAAWAGARDSALHVEVDLYLLQPLGELVTAAARVGDTSRLQTHFARGLEIVQQLGSPPIWSAHLHWTGVQQGILLNRPDALKPHARALLQAAPRSPIAAVMAKAGRVWTACLAGSVDADAIEAAAHGLASAGLGWDGARLAGHGASRSTDRKVSARLLSCARELHPNELAREAARSGDEPVPTPTSSDGIALSERERDVARLVLQGKTYAEIGETIFISPRTAEHHIAHIKRRLGATSRSDLMAKLRVVVEQSTRMADGAAPITGPTDLPPS